LRFVLRLPQDLGKWTGQLQLSIGSECVVFDGVSNKSPVSFEKFA